MFTGDADKRGVEDHHSVASAAGRESPSAAAVVSSENSSEKLSLLRSAQPRTAQNAHHVGDEELRSRNNSWTTGEKPKDMVSSSTKVSEPVEWDPFFGPPVVKGTATQAWLKDKGKSIAGLRTAVTPASQQQGNVPQEMQHTGFMGYQPPAVAHQPGAQQQQGVYPQQAAALQHPAQQQARQQPPVLQVPVRQQTEEGEPEEGVQPEQQPQQASVQQGEPQLPPGWEQRVDPASGRPFYVDHNTKQSSWVHPAQLQQQQPAGQQQQLAQQQLLQQQQLQQQLMTAQQQGAHPQQIQLLQLFQQQQQQQQVQLQQQQQQLQAAAQQPLPAGWERRVDPASGRPFYVDHNTQRSSWVHPAQMQQQQQQPAPQPQQQPVAAEQPQQQQPTASPTPAASGSSGEAAAATGASDQESLLGEGKGKGLCNLDDDVL